MTREEKHQARVEYIESIIHKAWTWEKMTDKERKTLSGLFYHESTTYAVNHCDSRVAVHSVIAAVFGAYLDGLGYTSIGWRE